MLIFKAQEANNVRNFTLLFYKSRLAELHREGI